MPKLTIDGREIEVPEGTKVIHAAEMLGITIPRFCYHPGLGSVGACRVCAVKFVGGPVKGINMSCMVEAQDGMVVSTTDPEAVLFRQHVIEWLMLNHPHDCPVCDEGGHCLLQDLTIAGGHSRRRYTGKKRTHRDQYLGPLVQHEMNRCIQCYRCVRFYQEFSGYTDLGVMGNANKVYFGRFEEGILESPFSGNLIDICPTGVFTDKPSRFTGRRWDFQRAKGICLHCSLGCHTTVSVRNRKVVRQEARFDERVNGYFICDRGRYGFEYANLNDRPRQATIDGKPSDYVDSVKQAGQAIEHIVRQYGENALAVAGSARSCSTTLMALKDLCRMRNWTAPVFFESHEDMLHTKTALSRLAPETRISMKQMEAADLIVAVTVDVLAEAPMLALAMRQAQRSGAKIIVLNIGRSNLPFESEQITESFEKIGEILGKVVEATKTGSSGDDPFSRILFDSHRPVLICGTQQTDVPIISLAGDLADELVRSGKQAGLFYVLPKANSAGAAIIDEACRSAEGILEGIENGQIKALLAVESDLWTDFPDRRRLDSALNRLELLVVLDYLKSPMWQKAHVAIPTRTVFESGGIWVNQGGLVQQANPVFKGGTPIEITGRHDHPPRFFNKEIPGAAMVSATETVRRIFYNDLPTGEWSDWMAADTAMKPAAEMDAGGEGYVTIPPDRLPAETGSVQARAENEIRLLVAPLLFGTETLSMHSSVLQELELPPVLVVSQSDAELWGVRETDLLRLKLKAESIELPVRIDPSLTRGVILIPRSSSVNWQQADNLSSWFINETDVDVIKKE